MIDSRLLPCYAVSAFSPSQRSALADTYASGRWLFKDKTTCDLLNGSRRTLRLASY